MYSFSIGSLTLLLCVFIILPTACVSQAGLDIYAYEYQGKFKRSLSLGECPFRQVAVKLNGTVDVHDERCTFHKKGVIRNEPNAMSETVNQLITSPKEVVANLKLCGGEAASYLGILHQGECMTVDVASRLTFSNRTVVRAFMGKYQTSMDILDTNKMDVRDGMEQYYKNKYYVKNRSYGTLEMIFVQFRYWNDSQASVARNYSQADKRMSSYMAEIKKRVGEPKSVKIISLSTASNENYKVKTEKEWLRALRYVQILELTINSTREQIEKNKIDPPHLVYMLSPFLPDDVSSSMRFTDSVRWEETSMMEVQMKQTMSLVKKLSKKCKKNQEDVCRRVRSFRRKLKTLLAEIHKGRSAWMNLTTAEKKSFVARYAPDVDTHINLAKSWNRQVRKMVRKQKLDKLSRKRNKASNLNETSPSFKTKGAHRIRHWRRKMRKNKSRKAQLKKKKPTPRSMGWF